MKKLIAYLGSGPVKEEDIKKLDGINIAFGGLTCEGEVLGREHEKVKMIPQLKKWNPNLKIVLSLVPAAGEAASFTVCSASETLRQKMADSIVSIIKDCDLDGIDLDWEFPCVPSNGVDASLADKHNFTLLCKTIRETLDKALEDGIFTERKIFSIAAGADLYYVRAVELKELDKYLDYICLMTYDLKCGFHALAGHHTSLYSNVGDVFMNSCDQALRLFHEEGFPKEKLLMGAAFYSRKWENIQDRNHGLLQICKNGGGYGPDFDVLDAEFINKNGYVRYWDDEAKAPYLFNGSTFLSYDDEQSLTEKAKYCVAEGYAGIFYWEHKCDKTGKLLDALYRNLK